MKIRYTRKAVSDLEAIADYLTPRSPEGALRVRAAILRTLQNLTVFPLLGRRQTVEGVRKVTVRKFPYFIYYSIDNRQAAILVLTIQHAARERAFAEI